MSSDRDTAIDRPSTSSEARPQAQPQGHIRCSHCGKILDGQPNFCPACGGDVRGVSGDADTLDGTLREELVDNRYRVLEKLGEGGMGAVYKVEHVRMGKLAALKLLRPDHALDKSLKGRFLQEARVVAKLSHPNTVQVFDSGELADGGLFIAMEYVPGKDLAWHLKAHGPITEQRAAAVGIQLLASLQEAHEAGVVHRDLKPANVMLVRRRSSGDDQVKLLDFGIAKLQEAEGRKSITGDFIGTPAYMSPEQIRGDPVDARSDLYSLGCLLFELVSGQQPFTGPTPMSVLTQHYETPIPRLAEVKKDVSISQAFQSVLDRATAKRPEDRWPDAEAMRRALEQLRGQRRTDLLRSTPIEPSQHMLSREDFDRFERRLKIRRALAPVVTVGLLVAALAGGWGMLRNDSTKLSSSLEIEPNEFVQDATHIALGAPVQGTMGAAVSEGDRDLYVTQVVAGSYRLTLEGVADLNLTVEVLQLEEQRKADGTGAEKLVKRVFLDDVGPSENERIDGLALTAGEVFIRIEEQAFCSEPNRPSREKSLVPYTLKLEAMPIEGIAEVEPNDTPNSTQALPLTRAVMAWTGARVEVEKLSPLRPEVPFSAVDWFRIPGLSNTSVMVAVVPPERGVLLAIDGAAFEASLKKPNRALSATPIQGGPQLIELKPMADGERRLRIIPGEGTTAGSAYWLAAGIGGDNGLAAIIDLARVLQSQSRTDMKKELLESTRQRFVGSSDLSRLGENSF